MGTRLQQREKDARAAKQKETEVTEELTTQRETLARLKGVVTVLQGEHGKAKEDFREMQANRGPTEQDAMQGLLKADPGAYTTMMTDLAMGVGAAGSEPLWAKLPFLERAGTTNEEVQNPKERLLEEIGRLKQEASEFGYELEKA